MSEGHSECWRSTGRLLWRRGWTAPCQGSLSSTSMCFSPSLTSSTSTEFPLWWECSRHRWTGEPRILGPDFELTDAEDRHKKFRSDGCYIDVILPLQYPRVSSVCLLHGRHRESILGSVQRTEDPWLCVDAISRGEAAQTSVRILNMASVRAHGAWLSCLPPVICPPFLNPSLSRLNPMQSNLFH